MANNVRVTLNHAGMRELLTSPGVTALVAGRAASVAASIGPEYVTSEGHVVPILNGVIPGRTQRAGAAVTLAHPAGLAIEGKHGVLAQACAENGLELKERA